MSTDTNNESGLKLLWGVEAIAGEIRRTKRQTYYLLESGRLPAMKKGGLWVCNAADLAGAFSFHTKAA